MQCLSTWSETGFDISTPNYFHVQNMQYMYLSTWSETGIDMSAPNYLHVDYMKYTHCLKTGVETLKPNGFYL